MAAIIEFRLPTKEFALKETLDTHPTAHTRFVGSQVSYWRDIQE